MPVVVGLGGGNADRDVDELCVLTTFEQFSVPEKLMRHLTSNFFSPENLIVLADHKSLNSFQGESITYWGGLHLS